MRAGGTMRTFTVEPVGDVVNELGEGPHRIDDEQVSWVDIPAGLVWRARWSAGGPVDEVATSLTDIVGVPTAGAALPTSDGGLLVLAHDRLATIDPAGVVQCGPPLPQVAPGMRFNDAGIDPAGRAYVGTLSLTGETGRAALLRVGPDGSVHVVRVGLSLANGMGWSPSGDTMYLIDSVPGLLWSAPYDVRTGEPGEWRVLVDGFEERHGGVPDGMCVDAGGRLWVAIWGGARVVCLDPSSGDELARVDVPAPHVTCCAFVGPARDRMLVTTARNELSAAEREAHPLAGRLFLGDVGSRGLSPTRRWEGSSTVPPWGVGSRQGGGASRDVSQGGATQGSAT